MAENKELRQTMTAIERQFGRKSIMALGSKLTSADGDEPIETRSTGSLALDLATGVGGYPKGRVVELFGAESSGKTTLALHAIVEVQKKEGVAAYIDLTHGFDIGYARDVGVVTDKLLVSQPDTGEQALDIAEVLARSGAVDLVVLDSVDALVTRAEIEGETSGDDAAGLCARLVSQALRKLTAIADRTKTTILFLNTLRRSGGSVAFAFEHGNPGCNAIKFYASMRIEVQRISDVMRGDVTRDGGTRREYGRTRVKIAKNKCAPPFREGEFFIRYGQGIDGPSELLELGLQLGVLKHENGVYAFGGITLGRGRERACETIRTHPYPSDNRALAAVIREEILRKVEKNV